MNGVLGFFDGDSEWVTVTELARAMDLEHDRCREVLEDLADLGIVNVERASMGEVITAQPSAFAVELAEADDELAVLEAYVRHGKPAPEGVLSDVE